MERAEIGVQFQIVGAFEAGAVAGVEIGLGGEVFGEDDVVAGEFDMPVLHGRVFVLGDGDAIQQGAHGDQDIFDGDGVGRA